MISDHDYVDLVVVPAAVACIANTSSMATAYGFNVVAPCYWSAARLHALANEICSCARARAYGLDL